MTDDLIHKLGETEPNLRSHSRAEGNNNVAEKARKLFLPVTVIILGIACGYLGAGFVAKKSAIGPVVETNKSVSMSGKASFGNKNTKLCPDKAEGTLKKGGIDGEGTHHLERKGGKSQNVYLTSSDIDLSLVVNKKVTVWGKTYAAQTAGWLMDACYLEVN